MCFCSVKWHFNVFFRYRGPAPIHHTIMNGDLETGISIIDLHPTVIDAGRISNRIKVVWDSLSPFLYISSSSLLIHAHLAGFESVHPAR